MKTFFLLFLSLFLISFSQAQSGTLDTTFAHVGWVQQNVGYSYTSYNSMAVQSDGKIIVGGVASKLISQLIGSVTLNYIARYNTDGSLDNTFGNGGIVYFESNSSFFYIAAIALAIQTDGKILAGGALGIFRFNTNGSQDLTFGTAGKADNYGVSITTLKFQSGGKIVASGASNKGATVLRYNGDGSLDLSFGTAGKVINNLFITRSIVSDDVNLAPIVIQNDDKIILGGTINHISATDLNHYDIAFVRYNANGTLDASYGTGGKIIADLDNRENYMGSMALQSDGKLVFDGSTDLTTNFSYPGDKYNVKLVVGRYNTNGTVDATFGDSGGSIKLDLNNALGSTIAIEGDGKIIAGGIVNYFNRYSVGADFALASIHPNGTIDSSFGTSGTTRTDFALTGYNFDLDHLLAISISNNRVYAAGRSEYSLTGPTAQSKYFATLAAYVLAPVATSSLSCPVSKVVSNDAGKCSAIVWGINPSAAMGDGSVNYTLSGATTGSGRGSACGLAFNRGVTTVTYSLRTDTTKTCSFTVTVNDTEPPAICGLSSSTKVLWPANHSMKDILLNYTVTDNCGVKDTKITVSSNEAGSGQDWDIVDNHHLRLRAERSGNGSGRVYTIKVTSTDVNGNVSSKTLTVSVPHDRGAAMQDVNTLVVSAWPNPSARQFTFLMSSGSDEPVTIRVLNAAGKIVEIYNSMTPNNSVQLGSNYLPGLYYAEVSQGSEKIIVKLVKQ